MRLTAGREIPISLPLLKDKVFMAKENATEFLVRTLPEYEGAQDVIVIYLRQNMDGVDEVDWQANDVALWKLLGMIEFAKHSFFDGVASDEEE